MAVMLTTATCGLSRPPSALAAQKVVRTDFSPRSDDRPIMHFSAYQHGLVMALDVEFGAAGFSVYQSAY